jgi:spermidine synthase
MLPFFFSGLGIGIVISLLGRETGRIYSFDILGAGIGSLGIIGLLFLLAPGRILTTLSSLAFLAAAIATVELRVRPKWLVELFVLLALAFFLLFPGEWVTVHPSTYKDLSQTLNIAGMRVAEERSGPLGQISVVESTRIPFRHAPGMSLNANDEPPPQLGVFVDGEGPSALVRFDGALAPLGYLDQLTSALPYHLQSHSRVLVLGAGAGSDVLQALYHGATSIDAVELDANMIALVRERFREYSGGFYDRPDVRVHAGEARAFVNASHEQFDLIQVALLDSFGTVSAGLYGLNENYLYTREALQKYLERLSPNGMLAVTRWHTLPPRDVLKLFVTAITALEKSGVAQPGNQLALIRGWKTTTLLMKNGAITQPEIDAIREFCRTRSFDVAYFPGMRAEEGNRYNLLEQDDLFEGAMALLGPQKDDFIHRYKFYIEPASDDRPFFFRFFKWDSARELFSLREQGGTSLLDWGYPLLIVTLIQAVAASALLIVAPLLFSRSRRSLPGWRASTYFFAIGLAFMFMEIAFIQKFVLFLGHPLYAVAVVLCAFLIFASIGSRISSRRMDTKGHAGMALPALGIGVVSLLYLGLLPGVFGSLIHLPDAARIGVAVALIAPLAICMGVPFPAGMMRMAQVAAEQIPWLWAINGFASVVGAVLAMLLAIHFGFAVVILLAVVLYGVAWAAY